MGGLGTFVTWSPVWFANLTFWSALWPALAGRRTSAVALAALSVLLGLSGLLLSPGSVSAFKAGYYCWLGSFCCLPCGLLFNRIDPGLSEEDGLGDHADRSSDAAA